ncbi:DUF2971 domain-containing protein [Lachnoclostridium sp. An76]|uniref:DUF2971 domain-containing protein n=1 Tax=Lachnoclostridium sp. An76 TaxID=1965654 RepID=UPI000B3A824E|nr:DUF2971 domain-containing protein [Lachnoclostridium sp. An76]OUN33263.1 hypothetical protein B5G27_12860 [Lachnoclostridium sp. An76]
MDYSKYIEEYLIRPDSKFQGEGKYFHYTSLESCINMLKHTDGEFEIWASHLSFLNDKEELINGMKLIDRKVEDLLLSKGDTLSDWIEEYQEGRMNEDNLLDDIYVVCFCSKRSLLSQWKYYGKNSGIAIEYNLDFCEYSGYIASNIPFKNMNQEYLPNYVNKVIYDNMEKQEIIDAFIKEHIYKIYNSDAEQSDIEKKRCIYRQMDKLYSLAPLFKHDSFQEENESRLLFFPLSIKGCETGKLVNYRSSDGKIVPYMKIKIRGRMEGTKRESVIKSLTVGPGQNQDLIFEALKHLVINKFPKKNSRFQMIQRKDYSYVNVNGIEIRKVSTPFRG